MKKKQLLALGLASVGVVALGGSAYAEENYFADLEKDLIDGTLIVKADDPKNYNKISDSGWEYNDMIEIIIGVLADKYNVSYVSYDWESKDYNTLTFEKQGNCRYETVTYHNYVTDSDESYQDWKCDHLGSKTVKVKYTGVDKAKKEKVMAAIQSIAEKHKWNGDFDEIEDYYVDDLSFINYFVAGYGAKDEDDQDAARRISNKKMSFSAEYRKDVANKNIQIVVDNRAGDSGPYVEGTIGYAGVVSDGYIYDVVPAAGAVLERVLYIPESTADGHEAHMAAAQKRIDDYYRGTDLEGKVKLNYDGVDEEAGIWGKADRYYVSYGGRKVDCIILKDDKKLEEPLFMTGDVDTNIVVSSENSSIPLDTAISVEEINNSERAAQLEKLGIKNAVIFDISLYSDVAKKKIEKLDDGSFKVSIPVDEKFNGKTITVYHFALDGTIEQFDAPVADGYAVFTTTHFSEYIVNLSEKKDEKEEEKSSEKKDDIVNPPTSDNIATYVVLFVGSLLGAAYFINKR